MYTDRTPAGIRNFDTMVGGWRQDPEGFWDRGGSFETSTWATFLRFAREAYRTEFLVALKPQVMKIRR
jgi:hypothetical protein